MAARAKLKGAFFQSSLLLASAAGVVTGSWLVCGLTLVALVAFSIATGLIR